MKALVKVTITAPANMDAVLKKYTSLRMYLSDFKRTPDGGFISEAEVDKVGDKHKIQKDELELRLTLLDWGFNEQEEADEFYKEYPNGFQWNLTVLCEI